MGGCTTRLTNLLIIVCIVSSSFVVFSAGKVTTTEAPEANSTKAPRHLKCFFCRSDTDLDCLNRPEYQKALFVKKCTNETFQEFKTELADNPPDRPIPNRGRFIYGVEGAPNLEWRCYSVFSSDATFAMRTCTPVSNAREGCQPCSFDGRPAKCCYCGVSLCNDEHSGAPFGPLTGWKIIYLKIFVLLLPSTLTCM